MSPPPEHDDSGPNGGKAGGAGRRRRALDLYKDRQNAPLRTIGAPPQGPRLKSFSVRAGPASPADRRTSETAQSTTEDGEMPRGRGPRHFHYHAPPPPPREPSRLFSGFLFGMGFAAGSALFRVIMLIVVYGAVALFIIALLS